MTSLVPSRGQQSSAVAEAPEVGGAKPASTGGRLSNAAEFALTKVDDIVNWARKVSNAHVHNSILSTIIHNYVVFPWQLRGWSCDITSD